MASRGKKKTTMAKLNRERKLRERRLDKQAKKDARQHASAQHPQRTDDVLTAMAVTQSGPVPSSLLSNRSPNRTSTRDSSRASRL